MHRAGTGRIAIDQRRAVLPEFKGRNARLGVDGSVFALVTGQHRIDIKRHVLVHPFAES